MLKHFLTTNQDVSSFVTDYNEGKPLSSKHVSGFTTFHTAMANVFTTKAILSLPVACDFLNACCVYVNSRLCVGVASVCLYLCVYVCVCADMCKIDVTMCRISFWETSF